MISAPVEPTPDGARRTYGWSAPRWLRADVLGLNVLALAGLLAYAYLRIAYTLFYRPLGVVPEDIGLGYADILTQSVVGLVAVIALGLMIGGLIIVTMTVTLSLMNETGQSATSIGKDLLRAPRAVQLGLGAIFVLLVVLSVYPGWDAARAATGFILYGMVCAVLPWAVQRWSARGGAVVWRWASRSAVIVLLLAGLVLGLFVFIKQAEADGVAVRDRGEARHPTLGWLPMATWGADPARVLWQRDAVPDGWDTRARDCLMYLGRTAETSVLFDVTRREVIRIPVRAATVIATTQDDATCATQTD